LACDLENRKAEAAAIHQLGRVDARADRTTDALRKLASALEIRRAIGDRAGEAISFRRLGDLAHQLNKPDLALRLTVVCYVIDKALEGEGTRALNDATKQSDALGYPREELATIIKDVEQDYLGHRAKTVLKQAFALA
jgi:hypothetical protein